MKVRDINFDTLSANYEGWTVDVRIFLDNGKYFNKQSSFESAREYLTALGYLDRECEVEYQKPVDPWIDKYIRLDISLKPGKTYYQITSNSHNNEVTKMKVVDIDFNKLQKENEKYTFNVVLHIDEGTHGIAKQFDSFADVNNYLRNHPKWFNYAGSDCELRHEESWNNLSREVEKHYILTINLKKKETPKVPYYQFHNGNCINVNGKTYAPEIKDVIFNPPATIVKWADGTKTVVKSRGSDTFDPEVGLAMAISKKMYGNNYSYYNVFKKWLKKFDDNAAKKALARVAKSVVAAMTPNPAYGRLRELEETNAKLKQATGYDSKELLDLFASGNFSINLVGTNSIITLASALKEFEQAEQEETTNCCGCKHFTPTPSNDPWEDDGVCEIDGKGTYGLNSCDKAVSKAKEVD